MTPRADRVRILDDLRAGRLDAVAAPRVLDEGVDVPDADLGVVVSASRTRRQMIQRMGRILRRKPAGIGARFVIMFSADTLEDPRSSFERDGFAEELESIADDARVFDVGDLDALIRFCEYSGPAEPTEPEWVDPPRDLDALAAAAPPGPDYIDLDLLELPEVERQRKKDVKKRLSTGENPVVLVNLGEAFVLQCTGCGAVSEPTPFRWKALDSTVECSCEW